MYHYGRVHKSETPDYKLSSAPRVQDIKVIYRKSWHNTRIPALICAQESSSSFQRPWWAALRHGRCRCASPRRGWHAAGASGLGAGARGATGEWHSLRVTSLLWVLLMRQKPKRGCWEGTAAKCAESQMPLLPWSAHLDNHSPRAPAPES